jgi:hypothetical protein
MFYLPTPLRGFTTGLQGFFSGPEYVLSANKIMRAHDYLGSGSVGRGALGDDEKGVEASKMRRQYRDRKTWSEGEKMHSSSVDIDNIGVHRDGGLGTIDLSGIPVAGWIAMGMMTAATPRKAVLARPRQLFMSGYSEGNYKRVKSAAQEWIEAQGWHELMSMIYADRAFIIEWFELCAQLGVQTKSVSSVEMDWLRDIIGGGQWEKAVTVSIDTSGWPV